MLLLMVNISGCAEWFIDAELEELCKSEGGVKVFETVKLTADQFRPDGYPVFLMPIGGAVTYERRLGSAYRLVSESSEVRRLLWVRLVRSSESVIRESDGKVLGQLVVFSRFGGGVPLSEGAGHICPKPPFGINFIKSIFVITN